VEKRKARKNYKKMAASLSALGAGALFGSATAEAGVVYSGPVNQVVGFGIDASSFYDSGPFGPSSTHFSFFTFASYFPPFNQRGILASACGCLGFLTSSGFLKMVDKGALWPVGSIYKSSSFAGIARRVWFSAPGSGGSGTIPPTGTPSHYADGLAPFDDKYALFAFGTGPDTLYGWIHLSLSVTDLFGSDPVLGPNLTIVDWAFEDSGQTLAAGDAPEPATAIPTGLTALALGAVGLRNWRKTRKAA
jgi:hypothetical protein